MFESNKREKQLFNCYFNRLKSERFPKSWRFRKSLTKKSDVNYWIYPWTKEMIQNWAILRHIRIEEELPFDPDADRDSDAIEYMSGVYKHIQYDRLRKAKELAAALNELARKHSSIQSHLMRLSD